MPPAKTDEAYLWDMLEAGRTVVEFVAGKSIESYLSDKLSRSAVERQIEIIGEAGRHVSSTVQQANPSIPWRLIAAQRHVLAHDYGEILHDRIWRVATIHVPQLIALLEPLVPPLPE